MGLTSALYTTLTGLSANQQRMDIIGNNISNTNTTGYKSSSLNFETLFAQTVSSGSPPSTDSGGTNPFQIGLGTKAGATQRNWNDGSREVTGVNTEMAIEGSGFFILQGDDRYYTRDGTFQLNSQNKLVNVAGNRVQGYGIDTDYNVVQGALQDITIPIGTLTIAKATSAVTIDGTLNAAGTLSSQTSVINVDQPIYFTGAGATPAATVPADIPNTLLTDLVDVNNNPYFQAGDIVNFAGMKGSASLPTKTLTVTGTTTVQDYLNFTSGSLGIDTVAGSNGTTLPDGGATLTPLATPTATFPANSAQLEITGNRGASSDITLTSQNLSIVRAGSTYRPFTFTKAATANGESVSTSRTIYDSIGSPVNLTITAVLTGKTSSGTTWQYLVESPDNATGSTTGGVGTNNFIGTATLTFDTNGGISGPTNTNMVVDRSNTGATPSLQFSVSFGNINALSGSTSTITASQDGTAKGVLRNFSIGSDGSVIGSFDNGDRRTLAQVALATFRNNQGLVDKGNNNFVPGSNSGDAIISAPNAFGAGSIVAGTLELSNVDLSQEFVNLISASTGFSASSRVISTSNTLLQELLQAAR